MITTIYVTTQTSDNYLCDEKRQLSRWRHNRSTGDTGDRCVWLRAQCWWPL